MRAPDFWYADPAPAIARLLAPLGALYAARTRARLAAADPWRAPVPVICVGNLTAGGTGKTPIVLDLANRLRGMGVAVHALSRGHGGRATGPLRVDPGRHSADDVGDEPRLLARALPTWIARDRAAGARAMVAAGAGAIVMDDGFQNPGLAKDLSILVVDGGRGFGNRLPIPAGPLRETVAEGLARAMAVVVMGDDRRGVAAALATAGHPPLRAWLEPGPDAAAWRGRRVLAFAGIGDPDKFFATLDGLGAELVETHPFPDHHRYRMRELTGMLARARALGAEPVTTAKDAVRLPAPLRGAVAVLEVAVRWETDDAPAALLAPLFGGAR